MLKDKKKKFIYQQATKPKPELFVLNSKLIDTAKFENLSDLNFNTLALEVIDLYYLSWRLMHEFNFFEKYGVVDDVWLEFIWKIERKYNKRDNPFHNFYHGLTGLFIIYYF